MIETFGVTQAIADFETIGRRAQDAAEEAALAGAAPVEAEVRSRIPVGETGDLLGSLRTESKTEGGVGVAEVIVGNEEVDYPVYVEFSPDKEPFLRPGADAATDSAISAMGDVIKGVIG